MSAIIGALRAVLSLDSAQFEAGLGKAQAKMAGIAAKFDGLSVKLAKVGAVLSVAGAGIALAIKGQIDAADQMGDLAQKLGIPVEELTKLSWAAKLGNISMDDMGAALQKLAQKMVNQPKLFQGLGVSITGADGKLRSVSEVMADVSDIFAKMPDGAEKTALAMQLFGKAGADMIPMLNGGKAGLQGMMAEAEKMGMVVTPAMAQAASQFNDNLDRLSAIAGGFVLQIASVMAPALKDLTDKLVGMSQWFAGLSDAQKQWAAWGAGIAVVIGPLLIALGLLATGISVVTGALAAMAAALWANPILAIAGAIALAAFLIWYNWDWLSQKFTEIMDAIASAANDAWVAVAEGAQEIVARIKFKWDVWRNQMEHLLSTVPQLFTDLWQRVKDVVADWVQDFTTLGGQIVDGLKKGISDKWDAMTQWFSDKVNGMTQGVKDMLGIQSPSKVFAEIGGFIGQGLQQGVEGSLAGIGSAMKGITDTLEASSAGWTDIFGKVGDTLKSAFVGAVTGKQGFGSGLRSGLSSLLGGLADKAAGHAFDAIGKHFGFANGGVFAGGNLVPFAAGGIVSGPTIFPMGRGAGLMGEAGPEAIMPLTRGAGGRLGVATQGRVAIGFDASTGDLTAAMYDAAGQVVEEKRMGIVRQSVGAVQKGARASKTFLG